MIGAGDLHIGQGDAGGLQFIVQLYVRFTTILGSLKDQKGRRIFRNVGEGVDLRKNGVIRRRDAQVALQICLVPRQTGQEDDVPGDHGLYSTGLSAVSAASFEPGIGFRRAATLLGFSWVNLGWGVSVRIRCLVFRWHCFLDPWDEGKRRRASPPRQHRSQSSCSAARVVSCRARARIF